MSRKYKFLNKDGVYFVSFATCSWIDVFIREEYTLVLVDNLNYCIRNLGMEVYFWCIMPSHVHLIFGSSQDSPDRLLGRYKEHTSKKLIKQISDHPGESRKEWMLSMFKQAAETSSNIKNYQFWQHHNHPIELWSDKVFQQKAEYVHNNPVIAGFVRKPEDWKYSSACDYAGGKGLVDVIIW